jgi:hypothetical protein
MAFVLSSVRRAFGPNGDWPKIEPFFIIDQLSPKEVAFSTPAPTFDQNLAHADRLEEFRPAWTRRTEDKKTDDFSADFPVQFEEDFRRGPVLGRGGQNIFDNESISPAVAQEQAPAFFSRGEKTDSFQVLTGCGGEIDIH